MKFSKTRHFKKESLPEDAIDASNIPELDDGFWENANRIVPENYLQLNLRYWNDSKNRDKITTSG
ncbi:MAG: hypothetical protein OXU23_08070 [Candidatus Poribacteria bacterium]|nr:hypothetical protein [Candidatus Poribacteria bacterium]